MTSENSVTEVMSFKEIEPYIRQLKVPEITRLLQSFGDKKGGGRKHDLIKKLELISLESPNKASELVRRVKEMRENNYRSAPQQYSISRQMPPQQAVQQSRYSHYSGGVQAYGGATMGMVQNMGQSHHRNPEIRCRDISDMRPVRLPFYDDVAVIVPLKELPPAPPNSKLVQKVSMDFQVPSAFEKDFKYDINSSALPRMELQLRFFHLGQNYQAQRQQDDFPLNAHVKIDDQEVVLPNLIPTNKPNAEPKRLSRPVCITSVCSKRIGKISRISIQWMGDRRAWAFGIYCVKRVNSDILHNRLKNNTRMSRSVADTRKTIADRLRANEDDGIAMEQLKISLLCPLTRVRMIDPVRGEGCSHLQCYDLSAYLQMNEKRPTWKCPVCSGPAHYDQLINDKYFENVLHSVTKDTTEVELKPDGSFEVCAIESIDLTDSDDDDDVKTVKAAVKPAKPAKVAEVIDLDDSDDDDMTAAKQASLHSLDEQKTSPQSSERNSVSPALSAAASFDAPAAKKKRTDEEFEVITLDDTPPRPSARPATLRVTEPEPVKEEEVKPHVIEEPSSSMSTTTTYSQQSSPMHDAVGNGNNYAVGGQHEQFKQNPQQSPVLQSSMSTSNGNGNGVHAHMQPAAAANNMQPSYMMDMQHQAEGVYMGAPTNFHQAYYENYMRNSQFPEPGAAYQYATQFDPRHQMQYMGARPLLAPPTLTQRVAQPSIIGPSARVAPYALPRTTAQYIRTPTNQRPNMSGAPQQQPPQPSADRMSGFYGMGFDLHNQSQRRNQQNPH